MTTDIAEVAPANERRRKKAGTASVVAFVEQSMSRPLVAPPPLPKRTGKPRGKGIWSTMTKEERSAYARQIQARRTPEGLARSGRKPNTPHGWTWETAAIARAEAEMRAGKLVKVLVKDGTVDAADRDAIHRLTASLAKVAFCGDKEIRGKLGRRLLREFGEPAEVAKVAEVADVASAAEGQR